MGKLVRQALFLFLFKLQNTNIINTFSWLQVNNNWNIKWLELMCRKRYNQTWEEYKFNKEDVL